jgi:hypothetical protein
MFFTYEHLKFRYDPFPIGLARPLMDEGTYRTFVENFPPLDIFKSFAVMGKEGQLDLGYRYASPVARRLRQLRDGLRGKASSGKYSPLRARFEFSALPVDGGFLVPHTDAPTKVATIVVSMLKDGEWDPAFGGGTDFNKPKSDHLRYNQMNRSAAFEDMDVIDSLDFVPNQGVMFVKTFNSWHSVRPMTGQGSKATRNTLTVTVEKLA